jgi:putative FmdB family regulatory protein
MPGQIKESFMPFYEFHCEGCGKDFDHQASISERNQKVPCPHCGAKKTGRKLSIVGVAAGGEKSPGTAGGGHVHSGMCGCGKRAGSCGIN